MEVIYLIIPFALIISLIFLGMFIMSVNSGQFDDLETPAFRAIIEEELINKKSKEEL